MEFQQLALRVFDNRLTLATLRFARNLGDALLDGRELRLVPLRAIYRRAVNRGDVALNPTSGLELPAAEGRRDRIVSREEAAALLELLPEQDRAIWTAAFFSGLRRGELRALRWQDVDFAAGLIRVDRS
jgi:integrase